MKVEVVDRSQVRSEKYQYAYAVMEAYTKLSHENQ